MMIGQFLFLHRLPLSLLVREYTNLLYNRTTLRTHCVLSLHEKSYEVQVHIYYTYPTEKTPSYSSCQHQWRSTTLERNDTDCC